MLASVLVKNWNGRQLLKRCLMSLLPGLAGLDAEVIVVDNRSADGSVEMVSREFPQVRVIVPDHPVSAAKATNLGIQASHGELVIHIDNDVEILTPDWLRRMAQTLEAAPRAGIVGCKIIDQEGAINHVGGIVSPWKLHGVAHLHTTRDAGSVVAADYVVGAVMLMTRALIDSVGLWDESYSPVYFDDTEYCARARRSGFGIVCNVDVVARHGVSQTVIATRTPREQMRIYHRNRLRFLRSYSSTKDLLIRSFVEQIAAARCLVRGQAAGYLDAIVDTVRVSQT